MNRKCLKRTEGIANHLIQIGGSILIQTDTYMVIKYKDHKFRIVYGEACDIFYIEQNIFIVRSVRTILELDAFIKTNYSGKG